LALERVGLGRHHDDLGRGELGYLAKAAAELVAVHLGHHEVGEDAVRRPGRDLAQGVAARWVDGDLVTRPLEQRTRDVRLHRAVVDDEDVELSRHPAAPSRGCMPRARAPTQGGCARRGGAPMIGRMRWLGPAVALMNRLSYPRKFALVSLVFAVPI